MSDWGDSQSGMGFRIIENQTKEIEAQQEKAAFVRIQLSALVQTLEHNKSSPDSHKALNYMVCGTLRDILKTLPEVRSGWSEVHTRGKK